MGNLMSNEIESELPRYAEELLAVEWFSHAHEVPEDAKADLIDGIGESIHAFTQESERETSHALAERFEQGLEREAGFTGEDVAIALEAFNKSYERDFRKKIRKAVPMSLHTKKCSDEFIHRLRYGFLAEVFPDVASGTYFRVWCDWLRRGHFACYWDGELDDSNFDDAFVLMHEYRKQ